METDTPRAAHDEPLRVDVWADVACPWCYIGMANLDAALEQVDAARVTVVYRSFELDPDAPIEFAGSAEQHLAARKGISLDDVRRLHDHVAAIGAAAGVRLDFASLKPAKTTAAHQLIHQARVHGLQRRAVERLYRAYFDEGRHIGRHEELASLGAEIGLDRAAVLGSLRENEYLDAVRDDERQAQALGIRGVPFTVIDQRYGLSGAQPSAVIAEAFRQVLDERASTEQAQDRGVRVH